MHKLTVEQLKQIKHNLKLPKNQTIAVYNTTRNQIKIEIDNNNYLTIYLHNFPNTCGTYIASRLFLRFITPKYKPLAFKILYEIAKIKRKSAIIYLAASYQKDKDTIFKNENWVPLSPHFVNKNSNYINKFYIKNLYK